MASLPTLSGREVVKAFAKDGWEVARQRGSHIILVKVGHMATLWSSSVGLRSGHAGE